MPRNLICEFSCGICMCAIDDVCISLRRRDLAKSLYGRERVLFLFQNEVLHIVMKKKFACRKC